VYPTTGFDVAAFEALVKQNGGSAMAQKLGFDPTNVAQVGDQAPTLVSKLKSSGVTSVVLFADNAMLTPLTKAATAQEYSPEWIFTGYGYQDFDGFARTYDQDQMQHAFGLSVLSPYIADAPAYLDLFTWYKRPGQHLRSRTACSRRLHLSSTRATLTAQNVKKGRFRIGPAAPPPKPSRPNRVRKDRRPPSTSTACPAPTAPRVVERRHHWSTQVVNIVGAGVHA
jgi:cell division septation protein DedD